MRHRKGLGPGLNHTATDGRLLEGNIGGSGSDEGTAGGDSGNPDDGTSRDSSRFNSGGGGGGGGGSSSRDREVSEDVDTDDRVQGDFTDDGVRSIGGEAGGGGSFEEGLSDGDGGDSGGGGGPIGTVRDRVSDIGSSIQDQFTVDDAGDFSDEMLGRGDGDDDGGDGRDTGTTIVPGDTDGEFDPEGINTTRTIDEGNVSQDLNQSIGRRVGDRVPGGATVGVGDIAIGESPPGTDRSTIPGETRRRTTPDQREQIRESVAEDTIFEEDEIGLGGIDDGNINIRTPETRADVNAEVETVDTDVSGGDGGFVGQSTATADVTNEPVEVASESGEAAIQPGADLVPADEVTQITPDDGLELSDFPTRPNARRAAIARSFQVAAPGIEPGDPPAAPQRRASEFARETGSDLLGLGDDGEVDIGDGAGESGAVGAATLAVAAPEPVSTTTGAAVLGGVALGGGITALASNRAEVDVPDRTPDSTTTELNIPDQTPATTVGEVAVPDRTPASSSGEIDIPDRTPASATSEVAIPDRTPATTVGEVDAPDIEAQQLVGQEPLFEDEEATDPEISEDDDPMVIGEDGTGLPADPFGTPQERGGTPDRFIDENRDPFVFPGGNSAGAANRDSGAFDEDISDGFDVGFGAGSRGSSEIGLGISPETGVGSAADTAADSQLDLDLNLRQSAEPAMRAADANATPTSTANEVANQTVEETANNTFQPSRGRGRRGSLRRRLRLPELPEQPDEDDDPFALDDPELGSDVVEFDLDPLSEIDDELSQGV